MTETNNVKTYRYKFSEDVVKSLFEFSKLHQYEKRKDYKESWEAWVKQNDELISTESRRLLMDGYNGNVTDKMYKSARYYFRTKPTAKIEPKKRRKYTSCNSDFIDHMDEYITKNYKEIENDMNICYNNIHKIKENNKRKKRQEISKSATRGLNSNNVKVVIEFD